MGSAVASGGASVLALAVVLVVTLLWASWETVPFPGEARHLFRGDGLAGRRVSFRRFRGEKVTYATLWAVF